MSSSLNQHSLKIQNVCPHYHVRVSIVTENKAAVEWLTDKGSNDVDDIKQYRDFQDALEDGLRNVAKSGSRLFRKDSLKTKQNWEKVDKWRKTHAVLFLLRYFLKSPNYKYFYNFEFQDYLQRVRVVKTYNVRYLAMTQGKSGDTFGLIDPPEWGHEMSEEVVVVNSKARQATVPTGSRVPGWFLLCVTFTVPYGNLKCPHDSDHVSTL